MPESIEQIAKNIEKAKKEGLWLEQMYWENRHEEIIEIKRKHS